MPIAGSYHYDCGAVLPRLRAGDTLQLRRQSANRHDDRAHALHPEIIGIVDPDEEWEPVGLRVWVG